MGRWLRVDGEMERSLRQIVGKQLLAGLDRAFCPAMLLRLEAIHVHRQLGWRNDVRQEDEPPAGQLRAVAQVQVFRQGIVLPAACFFDAGTPPETPRCR